MRGGAEILWSDVVTVAAGASDRTAFCFRLVRVSRPRIRLRLRFSTWYYTSFSFFQIKITITF